jgi:sulfatase modifying factor 1
MIRTLTLLVTLVSLAPPCCAAITFEWAFVGNAGNAANPETNLGAVSYSYAISKQEVTNAQYVQFLNSVDPTGANLLSLYNGLMAETYGGITNTGNTDGARYAAIPGRERHPVNYVSGFDSMRFVNWLHNGQGNGDTESGVYDVNTLGTSRYVPSANAKYWIPTIDEWYKAAFHDASAGTAGEYFAYSNGSDTQFVSDLPADNPKGANVYRNDGVANGFNDGYAVTGSTAFPSVNPFTDVGAYFEALSPYGTFDQSGNVWEWIDRRAYPSNVQRGASFMGGPYGSGRSGGFADYPVETLDIGLRVAGVASLAVPEPTSLALAVMLASCGVARLRQR